MIKLDKMPVPELILSGNELINEIERNDLIKLIEDTHMSLSSELTPYITDNKISCKAFYYRKDGPILIMFALSIPKKNDIKRLIKKLTGEESLGDLFDDQQDVFVRIFRCPKTSFPVLQKYCAELLV